MFSSASLTISSSEACPILTLWSSGAIPFSNVWSCLFRADRVFFAVINYSAPEGHQ